MKKILTALLLSTALPAHADIISTSGLTIVGAPAPGTVVTGDLLVNSNPFAGSPTKVIWEGQKNVLLPFALSMDVGGILPAGTAVDAYFMMVNDNKTVTASTVDLTGVRFDVSVLGFIGYEDAAFNPSGNLIPANALFGNPGVIFDTQCPWCGFESILIPANWQGVTPDSAAFSGNTARFNNHFSNPGDLGWVVTKAAAVPGPLAGAGFPGLILALFWLVGLARHRWRLAS